MINLESLFKNFFDSKETSDDNLRQFMESHLARLAANNNNGDFNTLITKTTAAYEAYFGSITDEDLKATLQKSLTQSTDNIIELFKDAVSEGEGLIKYKYQQGTAVYLEFFPHGVTEYRSATKGNIQTLMNRFASAAAAHQADLGDEFVTKFTNFSSNYAAARNAQELKIGEVSGAKTSTSSNRTDAELQMCENIHVIGGMFPGQVQKCMSFFDQTIIRRSANSSNDGLGRVLGTVTANGKPLADVHGAFVNNGIAGFNSNNEGRFRSRNADVGVYTLRFTKQGYQPVEQQVEIVDDGDTVVNIELTPEVL